MAHTDRVGYLPQRVDGLDETRTVFENMAAAAPQIPEKELRNRMARFLIRGGTADRTVDTLSGGERFRVALAKLLLADPAPHLVVLDEPTNNLDLDNGLRPARRGAARVPRRRARHQPRRRLPEATRPRPHARDRRGRDAGQEVAS